MPPPEITERHLEVRRTARYALLGTTGAATGEVWFVCHGFGQLARYFIRDFAAIADERRVIVAPEALNRFYLGEVTGATSAQARVGATWMTREDRLADIADNAAWLDAVHTHVLESLPNPAARVVVLAFSQGVATACRWVAGTGRRVDRLIVWGGTLPPEFDSPAHAAPLGRTRLTLVLGTQDSFAPPERVAAERERMSDLGLAPEWVRYDGGHEIDAGVLRALAE